MSEDEYWFWVGVPVGFFVGFFSSYLWDYLHKPFLHLEVKKPYVLDPYRAVDGLLHIHVSNKGVGPNDRYRLTPRPALACSVTVQAFDRFGKQISDRVNVRWADTPEPQYPGSAWDIIATRTIDVHPHTPRPLPILFKPDGDRDCYLFAGESFRDQHLKWKPFRISDSEFRLDVVVAYEDGETRPFRVWVNNKGTKPSDVTFKPEPAATV